MKTLEAIQFLLDNPDEIIKEKDEKTVICYAANDNGTIMSCAKSGAFLCVFTLTADKLKTCWEVVKKPPKQVGFMEAINSGKRVRPVGYGYAFYGVLYWFASARNTLIINMVNGLWEIEN